MRRQLMDVGLATENEGVMAGSARSVLEDDGRICNMQAREATIEDLYQVEEGKAEREHLVRVYRSSDPSTAIIYRRGEHAEAEPALPGWTMAVDDLFPSE